MGHRDEVAAAPHWPQPDVLIIGAGASGAASAWRLASAGLRVVCLEQGDWVAPESLALNGPDWENRRLTNFHPDPNVRQLPSDYPINDSASAYSPLMFNAVGGSTLHWSAHFPRFHPSDFRVRSLDGVGDDWPLTYDELEPYYDLNDQMIGVSGINGDPAHPPRSPRQTPPIPLGPLGETIARGFDKLGWHWWPSDSAIITAPYGGRHACNNCGPCPLGCPIGASSSAEATYWPLAVRLGVELRTNCRVREITVDRAGQLRGALYYDAAGQLREQTAPIVIVACNGIGTPRLLLNSGSRHFPDGLANHNGVVGKNLMYHAIAGVTGIFAEDLESYKGPSAACIFSNEFYETDQRRGFVRGYQLQISRQPGPVGIALGSAPTHRVPWGRDHHAAFASRFGRTGGIGVTGEDLPEACNEVVLDPLLTDAHGIPAPLVRYRLSENSLRMLDHGVARATEALEASGAVETIANASAQKVGWHLLGTCRMGDDPRRAVVDRWGQAYSVPNLFIVDGSTFVTSAGTNPTTTIQVLALRTADYILRERGNLGTGPRRDG